MANYTENSHSFKSNSPYYTDYDPIWELIDPFISMNPTLIQDPNLDSLAMNMMIGFSSDDRPITHQTPHIHTKPMQNPQTVPVVSFNQEQSGTKKRKAEEITETSSLMNSSSPSSNDGITTKNEQNSNRGKKAKTSGKKAGQKHTEIVHVRARRGQATDSHSIAERVRRGKINERLRCLKNIVPGCYKTMGMALMLDEIINYVQSLQNQVEFLSMKLTAASQFHDFNADGEAVGKLQKTVAHNHNETQEFGKIIGIGGYDRGVANFFQPTWPF